MSSIYTIPAAYGILITTNASTQIKCRAVYIGTDGDYEFFFDATNTWVRFKGAKAGSMLPIMASGARNFTGGTAPTTGDITFCY
jgi:hypothetical protein